MNVKIDNSSATAKESGIQRTKSLTKAATIRFMRAVSYQERRSETLGARRASLFRLGSAFDPAVPLLPQTASDMLRVRNLGIAAALASLVGFGTASTAAQPAPRPSIRAIRIDEALVLDGDVLGDPVWQGIDPVTGFVQVEPDDGEPASEKTEVRIGFDSQALYIGVVLYDREPETLTVSDSRRDANLDGEDSFRVIFDTFHDHTNGFVFGTNLAGIQHDGQVTDEGRSGGGAP